MGFLVTLVCLTFPAGLWYNSSMSTKENSSMNVKSIGYEIAISKNKLSLFRQGGCVHINIYYDTRRIDVLDGRVYRSYINVGRFSPWDPSCEKLRNLREEVLKWLDDVDVVRVRAIVKGPDVEVEVHGCDKEIPHSILDAVADFLATAFPSSSIVRGEPI